MPALPGISEDQVATPQSYTLGHNILAAESTVAGVIMMGAYSNEPASIPA
jgi:hypothetical protein